MSYCISVIKLSNNAENNTAVTFTGGKYSMLPKVCHNGGGANARFVFCQLNSNIVNNIISTKALT